MSLCEWLTPELPVDNFENYPRDLYPLLTMLTFEKTTDFLRHASFSPGPLTIGTLLPGWHVILTLHDGDRNLPLLLTGWSWRQLCQLTLSWLPFASQTGSLPLQLPLSLGYCQLALSGLLALQAGDGIVLHTPNITTDELWLWLGNKRFTMIHEEDSRLQITETIVTTPSAEEAQSAGDMLSVPLTLIAEVGHVALSVAELLALGPGAILEGKTSLSGGIRLTVNGCCIGYGSLLMLQDTWVIRIDALMNSRISLPDISSSEYVQSEQGTLQDEESHGMAD
ncbi:hypothetical protein VL10_24070 [Leclercia adecarboxylata]|nr:hypothetical protein VL10_24070 [Leclercia adecarboxylata]KMN66754.1 hypothetical protein VK95_04510 [Leclercia sp. LK8]